jgi:environmental stress-induced protein Ves
MLVKIMKRSDSKVSGWSGGTTSEWFIWPPEAQYSKRDFQCRISTAKVELVESLFTPLPGVDRFIAPLDGNLTLTHNSQVTLTLHPLQVHEFPGDWQTMSRGQTQDLNLMLRGVQGQMLHLIQPQDFAIAISSNLTLDAFYFTQSGQVHFAKETKILQADQMLLVLNSPEDSPMKMRLEAHDVMHMHAELMSVS